MRLLLDTSVLIADNPDLAPEEAAISVASLAELHFGVQAARDAHERSRRLARLGRIESEFAPIPVDAAIARAWGALAALCRERGIRPRRRAMDLLIAATAQVMEVPLISLDEDLRALADVIDLRDTG